VGRFVRCKYRNTDNNACPICYVPVAADAAASGTAAESPEKAPSLLGKGTLRERRGKFSKSVFADPPCIGGRGTKKHVIRGNAREEQINLGCGTGCGSSDRRERVRAASGKEAWIANWSPGQVQLILHS
jgi:hypothetical protein